MAKSPFVVIPELTAIAVAYRNGTLIADQVLPYVPVDSIEFRYKKYATGDAFTAPDTRVSRKGAPNQVDWSEAEVAAFVEDHGLDAPVPNLDIEAWRAARAKGLTGATDPLLRATTQVMELVKLRREKRVADLVFNNASYAATNRVTLAPGSQFSDAAVKPQEVVGDAMDGMLMRPNIHVFGRVAWSKTRRNTNLVQAFFGQGTTQGSLSRQQYAELMEIDEVLVGEGFINTAAKGQAPTMARVWGKSMAMLHRNMNADSQYGITFGFTARFGNPIGGTIEDPDMGLRGGVRARAGESVREVVTANDLGYYFENCVA